MKKLQFFVPENFDGDRVLDDLKIHRQRDRIKDVYHYIIGTIVKLSANHRRDFTFEKDSGFIPRLKSDWLKDVIGPNYLMYVTQLEHAGILYRGESYLVGLQSKETTLTEEYQNSPRRKVEIRDLALKNQYRKFLKARNKEQRLELFEFKPIMQWMKPDDLRIDEISAEWWIGRHRELLDEKIWQSTQRKLVKRELSRIVHQTADNFLVQAAMINQGEYNNPHFDLFGYRFHTPLTNMKGELRHFLTYKGNQLVSVDIKNSQPYFLLPLLNRFEFHQLNDGEMKLLQNWINSGPRSVMKEKRKKCCDVCNPHWESIMLHNSSEMLTHREFQAMSDLAVQSFQDLVINGSLYETLQETYQGRFLINGFDRFGDRSRVKTSTLWLMYHDPKSRGRHSGRGTYYDPVELFQQQFPMEFAAMENLKSENYTRLPMLLQRIESFVMLHQVFRRISNDYPQIPLFPIHDCIMTIRPYQDLVEVIIKEECEKVVGAPPQMVQKLLSPTGAIRSLVKLKRKNADDVVIELKEKKTRNRRKAVKKIKRVQGLV